MMRATKGSRPSAEETRFRSPIWIENRERHEDGEEERREARAQRDSNGMVTVVPAHGGEGRDDLLGVRAQRLGALERAARGPERNSGPARQHMEMQMEHLLPAGHLVELLKRNPFRLHAVPDGMGDLLHRRHEASQVLGLDVEEVARRNLRDHQRVPFGPRHHVHEGERNLILVDFHAGRLAAQNFGEDVVRVIGRRQRSSPKEFSTASAFSVSPRLNGA